jgi:hydrogenase nickel incorporation protein HypA/HybF
VHELSVTEAVLEMAVRHGQAAQAARVTDVYLVMGQLSSVMDESVQFYWDLISAGTIAAGARLHFRRVAAALGCEQCGHTYAPTAEELACPHCQSVNVRVKAGEELYLEAIDIEPAAVLEPVPAAEGACL